MPLEHEQLLPGDDVPEPSCLIPACRQEPAAVRAEHGRHHAIGVPAQQEERLPGGGIPEVKDLVPVGARWCPLDPRIQSHPTVVPGDEAPAIWAEASVL